MISYHNLEYYLCKFLHGSFPLWEFIVGVLFTSLHNSHVQVMAYLYYGVLFSDPPVCSIIWIYFISSWLMSDRVIVSICIYLGVRGCTNSMCIKLRIPSILWPLLRTYVRVSPDRLPFLILRKLEDERIPYAVTSVFHFCILVRMTSGIISLPILVNILLVFMITRWP